MKIILSRKGFDSSKKNGGVPSPILLPDKTLLSLPIPTDSSSNTKYEDIYADGISLGQIVEDLSAERVKCTHFAHLDPDLRASAYPRLPNWRPLFGQADAAQTHLKNRGVTVGDLFLFFGWFREAKLLNGKYYFVKNAPNLHVIYGWLQIGEVLSVEKNSDAPPWAKYHHHFLPSASFPSNNTVYISSAKLTLDGLKEEIQGAGAFEKYREELCLTCPNQPNRSLWRLPKCFYPSNDLPPLSYHHKNRWELEGNYAIMQSVGKGQEFVLDADKYPEVIKWARNLIISAAT